MSKEQRPACPVCNKPMVQQPSIKSFRCHPCARTYHERDTRAFKRVDIETVP